jgi:biotin carboxyl carrier protein
MIFDASVLGRTLRVEVRGGDGRYQVSLDGVPHEVWASDTAHGFTPLRVGTQGHELGLEREGDGYHVSFPGDSIRVTLAESARGSALQPRRDPDGPARLTAPMPGRIVRVLSQAGADVAAGQALVVIEAMKMENELRAPRGGRLLELLVREGQTVEAGALLAVVA